MLFYAWGEMQPTDMVRVKLLIDRLLGCLHLLVHHLVLFVVQQAQSHFRIKADNMYDLLVAIDCSANLFLSMPILRHHADVLAGRAHGCGRRH